MRVLLVERWRQWRHCVQQVRVRLWVAVIAVLTALPLSAAERTTVQIGLVDTFSPQFYINNFAPLILSLRARFPGYNIEVFSLDHTRSLTSQFSVPNAFVVLESGEAAQHPELGLEQLATRRPFGEKDAAQSTGALFIVKAQSPYQTLSQLQGKIAAAMDPSDFSGWLAALGEIATIHPKPEEFFRSVTFTNWGFPDVTDLVKIGAADMGILHTCEWEERLKNGSIRAQDFRLINTKSPQGSCQRSTVLYPNAMFAAFPSAETDVVRNMTVALLTLPPSIDGSDWVSNNKMGAVKDLMRTLQLGPYAYLRDNSLPALFERWKTPILLTLSGFLLLLIHALRVHFLLQRRTAELKEEERLHEAANDEVRQSQSKLEKMERAGMAMLMAGMFAHEIKQPLTNIVNFINGVLLMKKLQLHDQRKEEEALQHAAQEAYRAAEIVDRVRSATRRRSPQKLLLDLRTVATQALLHSRCHRLRPEQCIQELPNTPISVLGDPLELEIILVNFLNNAMDACRENPRITIRVGSTGTTAWAEVTDNGPGLSATQLQQLGHPLESSKPTGLGFGLAIANAIAEAHSGHLEFHANAPHGIRARLVLPASTAAASSENLS